MKRRDFCKALALSAAALAVPRAAAENTQGAVGRAVADTLNAAGIGSAVS